jgi:hypothetical protein
MAAHAKDEEVAGVALHGVLEFIVMDLGEELVCKGEKEIVFACLGKRGGEGLGFVGQEALEFIDNQGIRYALMFGSVGR